MHLYLNLRLHLTHALACIAGSTIPSLLSPPASAAIPIEDTVRSGRIVVVIILLIIDMRGGRAIIGIQGPVKTIALVSKPVHRLSLSVSYEYSLEDTPKRKRIPQLLLID
jgi:hypothetical protein